jgi:hypothetical protein
MRRARLDVPASATCAGCRIGAGVVLSSLFDDVLPQASFQLPRCVVEYGVGLGQRRETAGHRGHSPRFVDAR